MSWSRALRVARLQSRLLRRHPGLATLSGPLEMAGARNARGRLSLFRRPHYCCEMERAELDVSLPCPQCPVSNTSRQPVNRIRRHKIPGGARASSPASVTARPFRRMGQRGSLLLILLAAYRDEGRLFLNCSLNSAIAPWLTIHSGVFRGTKQYLDRHDRKLSKYVVRLLYGRLQSKAGFIITVLTPSWCR